jgi:hypothetical protein
MMSPQKKGNAMMPYQRDPAYLATAREMLAVLPDDSRLADELRELFAEAEKSSEKESPYDDAKYQRRESESFAGVV